MHTGSSHQFWNKLWAVGCSLKLAIVLASAITLLIMIGSLIMHYNPSVFSKMEQETMGNWLPVALSKEPLMVSWVPVSGALIILFTINTACCFIDWISKVKARWRKTGEYLIHAGFIFLTAAFIWGNIAGFRSGPHPIFPGETFRIPDLPAYSLRLDRFTPQTGPSGRPLDMINNVSLFKNDALIEKARVSINHPLIHDGLVILPTSFGQSLKGFRFHIPSMGYVDLATGSRLPLQNGWSLVVEDLFPDAGRNTTGEVVRKGSRLNNPAMLVSLVMNNKLSWRGWYFLRLPPPKELQDAGAYLRPIEPIQQTYSLITINRDPADKLALVGGVFVSIGVFFALFSFYRKRTTGDRPEI